MMSADKLEITNEELNSMSPFMLSSLEENLRRKAKLKETEIMKLQSLIDRGDGFSLLD
jgi:hypothetical protein